MAVGSLLLRTGYERRLKKLLYNIFNKSGLAIHLTLHFYFEQSQSCMCDLSAALKKCHKNENQMFPLKKDEGEIYKLYCWFKKRNIWRHWTHSFSSGCIVLCVSNIFFLLYIFVYASTIQCRFNEERPHSFQSTNTNKYKSRDCMRKIQAWYLMQSCLNLFAEY